MQRKCIIIRCYIRKYSSIANSIQHVMCIHVSNASYATYVSYETP